MAEKIEDIDIYYILKGRFKGTETNTFGLFIIFFSFSQKAIDNVLVAASHFSSVYETSPTISWVDFEEKVTQLKWKGDVASNVSHDLQLLLSNSLRQDMVEELIDAINNKNTGKIDHTLLAIFEKGVGDKSIALDFKTEKAPHSDILKIKDERGRKEKEEKEIEQRDAVRKAEESKFKVEDGAVVLPVNLVLGPVSGVPIFEVKPKDAIMIKISSTSEKGNYFIDLLNARTPEGAIIPVKGVVKDIYINALSEYELLIEIGPGVYGKTVESEKVKIKKYDFKEELLQTASTSSSAADPSFTPQKAFKAKIGKMNKDFFIWVIGGITLLLAILILYLFFQGLL